MTALQRKREKSEHSQKRHVIHKHTAGELPKGAEGLPASNGQDHEQAG
jgi:hypothetical protein